MENPSELILRFQQPFIGSGRHSLFFVTIILNENTLSVLAPDGYSENFVSAFLPRAMMKEFGWVWALWWCGAMTVKRRLSSLVEDWSITGKEHQDFRRENILLWSRNGLTWVLEPDRDF